MFVLISVASKYTYISYANVIETAERAAEMFNKIMISSCTEMIRYDLNDEFILLLERTSEDETYADVYQGLFANLKGRD